MKDMTMGKPARIIGGFALPMLLGDVFQQLYSIVDSVVVGRFVGADALAGRLLSGDFYFECGDDRSDDRCLGAFIPVVRRQEYGRVPPGALYHDHWDGSAGSDPDGSESGACGSPASADRDPGSYYGGKYLVSADRVWRSGVDVCL